MSNRPNDTVSVPEIDPIAASALVAGGAFLLDVREDDEWQAGHAASAHHIALGELGNRLEEVPADRTIVVVCRSGGRSAAAAAALIGIGMDATNLTGGMHAWMASSLPVVDNAGNPGVIA